MQSCRKRGTYLKLVFQPIESTGRSRTFLSSLWGLRLKKYFTFEFVSLSSPPRWSQLFPLRVRLSAKAVSLCKIEARSSCVPIPLKVIF